MTQLTGIIEMRLHYDHLVLDVMTNRGTAEFESTAPTSHNSPF